MASVISSPKRGSSPTADIKTTDSAWQTTRSTLRDRNAFMFNNRIMSDVTFVVNGNSWIPAHKYILAISSPVFFALFSGERQEKEAEIIKVPDCKEITFLQFLHYFYTDEVEITHETVHEILYLSKKYFVPSLTEKCVEFMQREIKPENVFHILQIARRLDVANLERRCWRLIDRKTKACLCSKSFLDADRDILVSLLKRDGLLMTEIDLFQHFILWAEVQCERENVEPNGREMRRHLGNAILFFRYPLMKQVDFAKTVSKSGILSEMELLSAFLSFHDESGPVQFSKRRRAGSVSIYDQIYAIRTETCKCKCACLKCRHSFV